MDRSWVDMDRMPLRAGHFRVLAVSSLEQVLGAALSTLVGIVLPLMHAAGVDMGSLEQGAIAASGLVGIMVGSVLFGALSDRYGYLLFFRLCPLLVGLAAVVAYVVSGVGWLVGALFVMGLGIGGGYSLDSDYISECMPHCWKLFMVGVAKATSSLGGVLTALVCLLVLNVWSSPERVHQLWLILVVLAVVTLLLRLRFVQSPGWLVAQGRATEAQQTVERLLGSDVKLGEVRKRPSSGEGTWRELFGRGRTTKVLFSGIPWACEGFGVYGVGVFLPMLVMALGLQSEGADAYGHVVDSVRTTLLVNVFIIPGFVLGLLLLNRCDHVRMQFWGFVGAAAGLVLLWFSSQTEPLSVGWALGGFALFEVALNAGPHLVTFILPAQIYPVADRGSGAGLAASFGKMGAVVGVVLLPVLLHRGGTSLVLWVTAGVQLTGALVTALLGRRVLPQRTHGLPDHSPSRHIYLN